MNTLVAAPTARLKDYSLAQWAAATEGHDRLMVTEETDYIPVIESHGIPALYYEPPDTPDISPFRHIMCSNRFNAAWETIVVHAEESGFSHTLSLETDIIPPEDVDIVKVMEENWDGSVDFLVHLYPYRVSYNRQGQMCYEMCCETATTETWRKALDGLPPTGVLYWAVYQEKYTNKRIDPVRLQHLEK